MGVISVTANIAPKLCSDMQKFSKSKSDNELKEAERYLPEDQQLLYNARQLLMSKSYGVDDAISKIPEYLKNDAGLNYDRLKWRRKRGRVDSSLEILMKIKNTKDYMIRPDKWWKERSIIARSLIYKKNIW